MFRFRRPIGIQEKFFLTFLLLDFLFVGLMTFTIDRVSRDALEKQIADRLSFGSRDILSDIDSEVMDRFNSAQKLASSPTILRLIEGTKPGEEVRRMSGMPIAIGNASTSPKILVLNRNGKAVAKTDDFPPFKAQDFLWTESVLRGVAHVETISTSDNPEVLFALPVMKDTEIVGIMITRTGLDFIKQLSRRYDDFKVSLLTSTSRIVLGNVPDTIVSEIATLELDPGKLMILERNKIFYAIYMAEKLPGLDWTLVLSIPRSEVLAPLAKLHATMLEVGLSSAIILALVVFLSLRTIVRPLLDLRDSMKSVIDEDDLSLRLKVKSRDEIGDLTHTFNLMLKEVEQQRASAVSSAKMAALGEMSAGVAHEINSPLMTITVSAELLEKSVASGELEPEDIKKVVKRITTTAERISRIVQGMRSFARETGSDPLAPVQVSTVVSETLELCRERFRNGGVKLRIPEIPSEARIDCRSAQIQQVLLNLLNNAFDAIQGRAEKWVEISAEVREGRVLIRVTDCGEGIPPEIRAKIFSPFFTTKDMGKGTGLGLSISQRIVEDHHGTLRIDEKFPNTSFIIDLPLSAAPAALKAQDSEAALPSA